MAVLVYGRSAEVAEWVAAHWPEPISFEGTVAIGIAQPTGPETARLIAGVVYSNLSFDGANIDMSIASVSPRWCSRTVLGAVFAYPFETLKVRRVTALTQRRSKHVRAFLKRLGFREEGIARHGYARDDAVVHGMLRAECRWIGGNRR
jgi:RimJ/RimL family protein N-acetyltransferase